MTDPASVTGPVLTDLPPLHTRALVGWVSEEEAIRYVLGRPPLPTDDLSAIQQLVTDARASVAGRPKVVVEDPVVSGDRSMFDSIAARPEVQASFAGLSWSIEWVGLSKVLPIQKFIKLDRLDSRVAAAAADLDSLVELCLPSKGPADSVGMIADTDGHGLTVSSLNPNLRVTNMLFGDLVVSDRSGQQLGAGLGAAFMMGAGFGHMNVARYQGRYLLRDGTHRAAGLLRQGVTIVPAVVVDAPSYEFVATVPGLFPYDVMFGDRPPYLADFWDNNVAADGLEPPARRVGRFRAEELLIPR